MPPIFKDLLLSKKFIVALLTIIGGVTAYAKWNIDPMSILPLLAPGLVYIGAQGWADAGKEKAKIDSVTAIKIHAMSLEADAKRPSLMSSTEFMPIAATRKPEAGFVKVRVMVFTAIVSISAGMLLYTPLSMVGGCAHPGQTTLGIGQCLLDDGVLGEVLVALGASDYLQQVENIGLTKSSDLIDCALHAIASQQAGAGSGSASLPKGALPASTLAQRANEALTTRRSNGK